MISALTAISSGSSGLLLSEITTRGFEFLYSSTSLSFYKSFLSFFKDKTPIKKNRVRTIAAK